MGRVKVRSHQQSIDAAVRRMKADLAIFDRWRYIATNPLAAGMTSNPARGYIGEFSIPTPTGGPAGSTSADAKAWQPVLSEFLNDVRSKGLMASAWVASENYGNAINTHYWYDGTNHRETAMTDILEPFFGAVSTTCIGMDLDTLTTGARKHDAASLDGYNDFAWHEASLGFCQYLYGRGVRLVRMAVSWDRLQRSLGGALATSAPDLMGILHTQIQNLNTAGLQCILDIHGHLDRDEWVGPGTGTFTNYKVGSATVTADHFADFHYKLAQWIQGDAIRIATVWGVGLMNEPTGNPAEGCRRETVIADFNSGTNSFSTEETTTSLAQDTSLKLIGAGSLKFTLALTAGYNQVRVRANASQSGNSKTALGNWIYLPSSCPGTAWEANPFAYTGGFASSPVGRNTRLFPGYWNYVSGTPSGPALSGACDDVGMEIRITGVVGSGSVQINVDDFVRGTPSSVYCVESAMQEAIIASRAGGFTGYLMVMGDGYGNAQNWLTNHPDGPWARCVLDKLIYEAHDYWDNDDSGEYVSLYATEVANATSQGY